MYKRIFFAFLVFLSFRAVSQTVIKGRIIDAQSRQPLEAALIMLKDNSNANAISDHYGNFSLKINNKYAFLIATFIGYKPDTISITGKKDILFEMQPDVVNLRDVVIFQNAG